jgi:uncharacterized peroxidase-related enzyme
MAHNRVKDIGDMSLRRASWMTISWIKSIRPESAQGRLKEIYEKVATADGGVHHLYQAQSLRPESILGHDVLYKSILHTGEFSCPGWFLEAVAVYTSVLNRCSYAIAHHGANMAHLLSDRERTQKIGDAFRNDKPEAAFEGKELALLRYTRKLTLHPEDMEKADIEALKKNGASDEEILEVNQVTAGFGYSNRVLNGLGVELGNEKIGLY